MTTQILEREQEQFLSERFETTKDAFEAAGSQIARLLATEREAAEQYEQQLQAAADAGRIVIDKVKEDSELSYADPQPAIGPWPPTQLSLVDSRRAARLAGLRLQGMTIHINRRSELRRQPDPEIYFTHGRTDYEGHLSDIEWHLAAEDED